MTIILIYMVLFLDLEGFSDNYAYIQGAIPRCRGVFCQLSIYTRCYFLVQRGCLTINHTYTVLFLDLDGLSVNYPYIHGAISRFRGVVCQLSIYTRCYF